MPARRRAARVTPRAAVVVLVVYVGLLLLIPSQLIFQPLGAPGTPANLWALGALLWWCAATVGGLNPVRGLTPTRVVVLLLSAAVLAAYANGTANGWYAPLSLRQDTDELWTLAPPSIVEVAATMVSAADRGLLAFAGWMGIVLVAAEGLRSWRDLELLATWMCWFGAGVASLGIVQFVTGVDVVRWIGLPGLSANSELGGVLGRSVVNRVSSTAVHPIEFGVVLACLLPLAVHRAIHRWGRPGASIPVLLMGVGACLSVSRSTFVVLAAAGLVLFLGWKPAWRIRALLVLPVAAVAMRLAFPGLMGTILSLFRNFWADPSVLGRTADYGAVINLYREHMVLGRGLFTFTPRQYRILDNQYLMLLIELGAIGLAVSLIFVLTAFFSARIAHRSAVSARARHLGLALSASVIGTAFAMATFDAWAFPMASGLIFLIVGLSGAAGSLAQAERHVAVDDRTDHHPERTPADAVR